MTCSEPKEVGVRATFRRPLPVFEHHSLTDSLNITDPARIDACNYGTGILRVTSVGNVLYTQYIADVHGAWPAWANTGIALKAGSVSAVDDGYVWYQAAAGGVTCRHYGDWNTVVFQTGVASPVAIAPIGSRAWILWQRNPGSYEIMSIQGSRAAHTPSTARHPCRAWTRFLSTARNTSTPWTAMPGG